MSFVGSNNSGVSKASEPSHNSPPESGVGDVTASGAPRIADFLEETDRLTAPQPKTLVITDEMKKRYLEMKRLQAEEEEQLAQQMKHPKRQMSHTPSRSASKSQSQRVAESSSSCSCAIC